MSDANQITAVSNREVLREAFFLYFKERLDSARTQPHKADGMILLMAGLDALANHWASSGEVLVEPNNGANRLRLFLKHHGQHDCFGRVSMPELRKTVEITDITKFEKLFPFSSVQAPVTYRSLDWTCDPTFEDLLTIGDINLGLNAMKSKVFQRKLIDSSYGGLVYKRFRCAWVHEFLPNLDGVVTSGLLSEDEDAPYYHYVQTTKRWFLVMSAGFLVRTFEAAIESFKTYAITNNKPLPK